MQSGVALASAELSVQAGLHSGVSGSGEAVAGEALGERGNPSVEVSVPATG